MQIGSKGSLVDELRMLRGAEPITPAPKRSEAPAGSQSFAEFLKTQLGEVNQLGLEADRKIQDVLEGKAPNPHDAQIAIQKADVAFKLMLSVKEQLEQTYQTVMRTSIG